KQDYPSKGIATLCRLFGKTRHAYYDHGWRLQDEGLKDEIVLQHVLEIRKDLPRVGTLKLHEMLVDRLEEHHLKIGRDYLFDLLREHHLHIRRRKRMAITTDSRHWMHKYSNLIKELMVDRPEQLWVSDITYIRMVNHWGYLSLITDAYSRKIMGFCFRKDLSAQGCIDALKMALNARKYPLARIIHHSDRGSQYCSKGYVDLLLENNIAISMTENGDPYENALAERVNGIIKSEFDLYHSAVGLEQTRMKIRKSIEAYNTMRPHSSCDFLTPEMAHRQTGPLKKRWKKRNYK
ncbi:IS3 family transposase, partial [Desertivirga xinjiangensis]|uniref:IS3 family transposase n=1 Tax=Desertivirga xinjiangensis TaxID=539206 RepID=UPI00210B10C0